MSPQTHHYWVYSLAAALQLIAYSESHAEAQEIARNYLVELTDSEQGIPGVTNEIRQQWLLAAHKKENGK